MLIIFVNINQIYINFYVVFFFLTNYTLKPTNLSLNLINSAIFGKVLKKKRDIFLKRGMEFGYFAKSRWKMGQCKKKSKFERPMRA